VLTFHQTNDVLKTVRGNQIHGVEVKLR